MIHYSLEKYPLERYFIFWIDNPFIIFFYLTIEYRLRRINGMNEKEQLLTDEIYEYNIDGILLSVNDFKNSITPYTVYKELKNDTYNIKHISFSTGDIVLDVGANIGMFSIFLAKRHPDIKIIAIEPVPENFEHLKRNIELNSVKNITALNFALTADGRNIDIMLPLQNPGGASFISNLECSHGKIHSVPSQTLDSIFSQYQIDRCKMMKIDCEGAEYEILFHSHSLNRIEYLSGEFHYNRRLKRIGYSPRRLYQHLRKFIDKKKIHYSSLKIVE